MQAANTRGLSVVAAAGNEAGPVQAPADVPGVLGVGASDANPANLGVRCSFSNSGPGVALLAPGCGSQTGPDGEGNGIEIAFSDNGEPAWANGTSEAAVIVSAAEASMRAYSPTLGYSQAQGCITSTLTNGGNLDVAAAFDACGLGAIVSEGMAAYQAANAAPTQPSNTGPPAGTLTPPTPKRPTPKITKHVQHHALRITVAEIPKGLRLQLVVQERDGRGKLVTAGQTSTEHTTSTLYVNRWDRIVARFLSGNTKLPAVSVNRITHATHAPNRSGVRGETCVANGSGDAVCGLPAHAWIVVCRELPGERLYWHSAVGQQLVATVQQQHDASGNGSEMPQQRNHRL